MKNIQPIQIWKDGQLQTAVSLDCKIVDDNLLSECLFYWKLLSSPTMIEDVEIPGVTLAEGNATMTGEDYLNWDGSNDSAYQFVANSISVTIEE